MRFISSSVHRSRKYEDTLQMLGGHKDKLFPTLREALSFAAALGYHEGRRLKLDEKAGREDIQAQIYNGHDAVDLIFSIALAEVKSTDILKPSNEKECIQIFEEYANGGLSLLTEWIERYPDINVEDAIWRGLKHIGFRPKDAVASADSPDVEF